MFRIRFENKGKTKRANILAGEVMTKGGFVVEDQGKVMFPASPTDKNIYLVDYSPEPTPLSSVTPHIPPYDAFLNDIPVTAPVSLIILESGEQYGTTEAVAGLVADDFVNVGTNGKLEKSADPTRLQIVTPDDTDGLHTLVKFKVLD